MPVSRRSRLGDYVLNGGEVAVLAIVEAVVRLLPGVMGNAESLVEESHEDGLLEYPVYTKPAVLARPRRARRCCCPATTRAIAALAPRAAARAHGRAPPRPAAPGLGRHRALADLDVRAATPADAGELLDAAAGLLGA